eukprot:11165627-Lingulodinium_polyedra.AAC.1
MGQQARVRRAVARPHPGIARAAGVAVPVGGLAQRAVCLQQAVVAQRRGRRNARVCQCCQGCGL